MLTFNLRLRSFKAFFKQPKIQQRIQLITQRNITGWEIWFQVEFACFIDNHEGIGQWYREWQYSVDRRRTKIRQYMAIDFAFCRKHTNRDKFIALEVKQNLNAFTTCSKMLIRYGR